MDYLFEKGKFTEAELESVNINHLEVLLHNAVDCEIFGGISIWAFLA